MHANATKVLEKHDCGTYTTKLRQRGARAPDWPEGLPESARTAAAHRLQRHQRRPLASLARSSVKYAEHFDSRPRPTMYVVVELISMKLLQIILQT